MIDLNPALIMTLNANGLKTIQIKSTDYHIGLESKT